MRAADGSEVWLMDSEGFFGPGVTDTYDAKIFTIATLLGGHLVYNTVKVIDKQAVNLLEMLARQAQLFRTRSSAESAGLETPDFLSVRSFPPLTWVVEDFVQELPDQYRHIGGATAWLKSYLSKANDLSRANDTSGGAATDDSTFLSKIYGDINVHTLFLPATSREHLQDLSKLDWGELTPEFREEVSVLRRKILGQLEAWKLDGRILNGRRLEQAIRFIVHALQRGMFHELPSLWLTWTSQVSEMSLQDADKWFASMLSHIDAADDPVPVSDLNAQTEEAREKAIHFYRELLRDFEINVDLTALHNRMNTQFQIKVNHYHEKVQRWVGDIIAKEKDTVDKVLKSIEIPCDPESLGQISTNTTKERVVAFAAQLRAFAARGETVKHGRPATMPVFAEDPKTKLEKDLRALVGLRALDNEREIGQYFKKAADAAAKAVDEELKLNQERLVGVEGMKNLRTRVAAKCWQAFDGTLAQYKWLFNLVQYKLQRSYVQSDTLESQLTRYQSVNDQRIASHFKTVLQQCKSAYNTKKVNLPMPANEEDVELEFKKLAASLREMLEADSRELADTELWRGTMRGLQVYLEEQYQHVRQKNVELWKVHSDEATRCAMRLNKDLERQCGSACFFNKVPWVHKKGSKEHLVSCLLRSGAGARMSPAMQGKVFETWYDTDVAHDANTVWNNFLMMGGTLFCLLVGTLFCCTMYNAAPRWPDAYGGASYGTAYNGGYNFNNPSYNGGYNLNNPSGRYFG